MSLTTLAMIAGVAAGPYHTYTTSDGQRFGFDPGAARKPIDQRGTESALAVRIGGLRPHVETRDAARTDGDRGDMRDVIAVAIRAVDKRAARKARMAAKRRRGWR